MPTYLLHGFRWHRGNIRVHIVLNDLEDATAEWIIAPPTSNALLNSFYTLYDFLPPSSPPRVQYPSKPNPIEETTPSSKPKPRTLTKRNTYSQSPLTSPTHKSKSSFGSGLGLKKAKSFSLRHDSTSESETPISRSTSAGTDKKEKPARFNEWSVVKLVEQYDPNDLKTASQPWAYVADYMIEVGLGVSIGDEMKKYEQKIKSEEEVPDGPENGGISARDIRKKNRRAGWFDKLKDRLQKQETMGWYVVVCGDEERWAPPMDVSSDGILSPDSEEDFPPPTPRSAGLKGFFSRRRTFHQEDTRGIGNDSVGSREGRVDGRNDNSLANSGGRGVDKRVGSSGSTTGGFFRL